MTFTYSTALSLDRDKVRFYVGDTDSANPLFTDEEIAGMLAVYPDTLICAAVLAETQASKYARRASVSIDGASVSFGDMANGFRMLASRLRSDAERGGSIGTPVLSGVSQSAMDGVAADTDRPPDAFRRDQFSNPQGASYGPPYYWR